MAKLYKRVREEEEIVVETKEVVDGYTLDLSQEEVDMLVTLLGKCTGENATFGIYNELYEVGHSLDKYRDLPTITLHRFEK